MGFRNRSRLKRRILLSFFASFMILSALGIGNSIFNRTSNLFPSTLIPNTTSQIVDDIISAKNFENFKQFNVTENTGSNQIDVIIDPVLFTEKNKYSYKDSIRVFKSPYGPSDEIVSQVYNLEPNAWETFSSSSDWGDPNDWTVVEGINTEIDVLPRHAGYKKVVKLYDNNTSDYCDLYRDISPTQISGTVYATVMTTTTNHKVPGPSLSAGIGFITPFYFNSSGTFVYGSNGVFYDSGVSYEANRWYTLKITFDCTPEKYSVEYWNESNLSWTVIVNNVDFHQSTSSISRLHFQGPIADMGTGFVAAIDYSWESGYEEDRILYISSANIAFIDDLTASETKTYRVFYNSTPTAPVGYTDISRTGYTVNFTDGASTIMFNLNKDRLRLFDKNGNEHMTGNPSFANTQTDEINGGGSVLGIPKISDGPIFIETWHVDDASEWSLYRYYANSLIYKYHKYSGSGLLYWLVFGGENANYYIDAAYYYQSSSWQNEDYDYIGGSWQNHYEQVDEGKMFLEDTGDPNIMICLWDKNQDPWADDILIKEVGFPNPAGAQFSIGMRPVDPYAALTSDFEAWQFYQDVGSTNVNDKQNFVDNLYDLVIANPPSISSVGPRNNVPDTEEPNILEIILNQKKYRPLDTLNITVHVTDNEQISHVFLNTNLFGSYQYLEMNLISGTTSDGYWSHNTTIPLNASKKIINYSIWANDTSGQVNTSAVYQFKVKKNPKPIIIIPPGEDITIIIIIIIGGITASSIISTTIIVQRRRTSKAKPKKITKAKAKKGIKLESKEIRKILRESEEQGRAVESIEFEPNTFEDLKKIITKPFKVIPRDILLRVKNLKNLTEQEKEALLKDLATIDEEHMEEWLKRIEDYKN